MNTLLALSIAIAAGLAVSRLARLVRLPNVTAFLVGGLIIGPSVLGILPRETLDGFSVVTEAALGFIAYSIGAEFKMSYLKRIGAKKAPVYRIVVADSRAPRDGRFIEEIGYYNPVSDPVELKIDMEKAEAWIKKGAQPSDTVRGLLKKNAAE